MKLSVRQRKELGEWAESHFLARAIAQGLRVSKPWGDSTRYDFVVEHEGGLKRVQVKSTRSRLHSGYGCHVHGGGRSYSRREVEFLALYIVAEDLWYIIPVGCLEGKQKILLMPSNPTHRFHPYREAWHLLCA